MALSTFPLLPTLGWPEKRAPQFQTARLQSMSGKRTTLPQQTIPRWSWGLSYGGLRSAAFGNGAVYSELETLLGFFNLRSADGMCFLYSDSEDSIATAQAFGTGDGVSIQFQLYRSYGGFAEPIYAPTFTDLKVAGTPQTPGVDYLESLGLITFAVAPPLGASLTWDGTFQFLCRFDQDSFPLNRVMVGLYEPDAALSFSSEINP